MEQAIVYIGIDVAKAYLDVSWAGEARGFSNEEKGHAALVRWLKTKPRAGAVNLRGQWRLRAGIVGEPG